MWPLSGFARSKSNNWNLTKLFNGAPARPTVSGNITLTTASARMQIIVLDQARDMTLPAEAEGLAFFITNASASAISITLKNDAGTALATIAQYASAIVISDGTSWMVFLSAAATLQA